jgi:hypothetical protein
MTPITFQTTLSDWELKALQEYTDEISEYPGELSIESVAMAILKNGIVERSSDTPEAN